NNTDGIQKTDRTRDASLSCHTNSCIGLWNREHVFAQSLATPSFDTSFPSAGTDVHNLRASDSQMNSSRSNRLFAFGNGVSSVTSEGDFFPGDEWKGDVARIIMYMYLRYPTQCIPNNVAKGQHTYSNDIPDILLTWNI
ncbi:endonuclease, partial [Polaribacter sp. BAL334]|uniref:endonuclease n=1 Tax=Polaribacter sp. BAL334 TaxID=1708178 RepID=UPI0018D21646